MTAQLRHYCRNPRCRSKLTEPTENPHAAFCTRGCYNSFYLHRCRVCEKPLRDKRGGRLYCRPPHSCSAEAKKWPLKYGYGPGAGFIQSGSRSAHSTGIKSRLAGDRPTHRCLCEWTWGGDGVGDHSLYNRDGLTIARVVLGGDGRYHLRTPVAIPPRSWVSIEEARRGAEGFALMAMPLDTTTAARIKRENSLPNPLGPPLNRLWPVTAGEAVVSNWEPTGDGASMPELPAFLIKVTP